MLTTQFFKDQMDRIDSAFSGKGYDVERSTLIYQAVKHLSNDDFKRLISHILESARFRPTPADIKETMYAMGLGRSADKERVSCSLCGGAGTLPRWHKATEEPFTFVCNRCPNGQRYSPECERWDDSKAGTWLTSAPLSKDDFDTFSKDVQELLSNLSTTVRNKKKTFGHLRQVNNPYKAEDDF